MSDDINDVGAFLDRRWGAETGKVYIATLKGGVKDSFKQYLVSWPTDREKLIRNIPAMVNLGHDVFYCPSVFQEDAPKPEREYVKSVNSHWVDLDGNAPAGSAEWELKCKELNVPLPTEIVQSSYKNHQHAYWTVERMSGADLDRAETVSRNLAAAFQADMSGWDLPQLLRLPGTLNFGFKPSEHGGEHKPWYQGEPVRAQVVRFVADTVKSSEFSSLTNYERQLLDRLHIGEVPDIREVLALGKWTKDMYDHFMMSKDEAYDSSPNHRSGALQKLAYTGAENGFTDDEIYAILDDADRRWEKYISRSKSGRDKILRDTIVRARGKIGYLVGDGLTLDGILGEAHATVAVPKFVYNYEEFMEADFHVDWLLEGLIPVDSFGLIVAQPNVGKTRLGLQLCHDFAKGEEKILRWSNTGAKKVGFLSLEMGGNEIRYFLNGFQPFYEGDVHTLKRNFFILPVGGELYMDLPEGQALVKNFLADYKVDILVIDSLQMSVSGSLTDEVAMKRFNNFIAAVRRQYNCAIIFIHHERKMSAESKSAVTDLNDVYGSQMINASIDWALGLQATGNLVMLKELKNRFHRKGEPVEMYSDEIKFVLTDVGDPNNDSGYGEGDVALSF